MTTNQNRDEYEAAVREELSELKRLPADQLKALYDNEFDHNFDEDEFDDDADEFDEDEFDDDEDA